MYVCINEYISTVCNIHVLFTNLSNKVDKNHVLYFYTTHTVHTVHSFTIYHIHTLLTNLNHDVVEHECLIVAEPHHIDRTGDEGAAICYQLGGIQH